MNDIKNIFNRLPERTEDYSYFADSFPRMPSVDLLPHHSHAIPWMSNEGFMYYLPFFLNYLENNPGDSSMLFHYVEISVKDLCRVIDGELIKRFEAINLRRFA